MHKIVANSQWLISFAFKLSLPEKCPHSEFFWSVSYGEILRISPNSVQMRENTDQKNSEYGQFLRTSWVRRIFSEEFCFPLVKAAATGVVLWKKSVVKNFAKFTGKPEACNLIKKEALAQIFSCEFLRNFQEQIFHRTPLDGWFCS